MATWKENKITELQIEINNHKGYGESKRFYQIREEIIAKVGEIEWGKILKKAKYIVSKMRKNE